jgi:hypothetical protein
MPFYKARDWEVHIYDPEAIQAEAVAALPADPLEFLADCIAWWTWLAEAPPEAITRDPQHGHRGPQKPPFPRPRLFGEEGPELFIPGHFRLGMGVYGPLGQGRREPNPPPREP